MSLIIYQPKTLNNVAAILISSDAGPKKVITKGDFTGVYVNDKLTAINVSNALEHFEVTEGAHSLTSEQIEVLEKNGFNFDTKTNLSIGTITSREDHPKSNRLFVLKVLAEKELQIVTNSTNSVVGKQVVVARVNSILPTGLFIVPSKVMGIESEGMLCGSETLGKEKSEGVLIVSGNNGDEFIL